MSHDRAGTISGPASPTLLAGLPWLALLFIGNALGLCELAAASATATAQQRLLMAAKAAACVVLAAYFAAVSAWWLARANGRRAFRARLEARPRWVA